MIDTESHLCAWFFILLVVLRCFPRAGWAKSSRVFSTSIKLGALHIVLSVNVSAWAQAELAPLHMRRRMGPLVSGWVTATQPVVCRTNITGAWVVAPTADPP